MMPVVTVLSRPRGAPMAITWSPTTTEEEDPIVSGCRSERARLEDGEVVGGVAPAMVSRDLRAVGQLDLDGPRVGSAGHHVVVGDDVALGVRHEARPGARAVGTVHADRDDAGEGLGRDVGDRALRPARGAPPTVGSRRRSGARSRGGRWSPAIPGHPAEQARRAARSPQRRRRALPSPAPPVERALGGGVVRLRPVVALTLPCIRGVCRCSRGCPPRLVLVAGMGRRLWVVGHPGCGAGSPWRDWVCDTSRGLVWSGR